MIAPLLLAWANPASAVADFGTLGHFAIPATSNVNSNDSTRTYTPVDPTAAVCTHSWWDLSGFGFSFTPAVWNSQQCSVSDASAALGSFGNECLDSSETLRVYPVLVGSWSSWTGPLTLNLAGITASNNAESVESAANSSVEPGQVEPRLTKISGSLAARELKRAWKRLMHEMPSDDTVLILTAHWAHETYGGRQMYNYNFGGIKGHAPDGGSCVREAHEGSGFHVRELLDRFRAYSSVRDGADDYLSLLIRKYPEAIAALERGDVTDFVAALKGGGYFTGNESDYAHSLSELVVHAAEFGFDVLSTDKPWQKQTG